MRVRTGDVVNDADSRSRLRGEAGIRDQLRIIAHLLADELDACGAGNIGNAGQIFVGLGGEHRDDVFFAACACAAFDHIQNARVFVFDFPDLIKNQQRRRACAVGIEMPNCAQDPRGCAIGERLPYPLRELFQRIEFIDIQRRDAGKIRRGRRIQKTVPDKLCQCEFEGFRAFRRCALERPGGKRIHEMRQAL